MADFLRIPPAEWKIREQTLVQIANLFPKMTALEFRRSLIHLVEQARLGRPTIQNHNAWIKAAFEKNGGPLVTEREIEARFEQQRPTTGAQQPAREGKGDAEDIEALRRYVTCTAEERSDIDRLAEEKLIRLRGVLTDDNRAGLIEEARLQAAREFFAGRQ